MKHDIDIPRLVAGALVIFAIAVAVLVVVPYFLVAKAKPAPGLKPYTEQQLRGRAVYVANGCIYCHSQQPRDPSQAPDATRGWGRPSVAGDYAYDKPHLLGTMRTGPDLFNIGARQSSEAWHLGHLFQPRAYGSIEEVLEASSRAREECWRRIGSLEPLVLSHLVNPALMGGPRWPAMRQASAVHEPT